jgi:GT2 family glycosyltransferase
MAQVDVITPSIASREQLRAQCEESVRRQTYPHVRHIIGMDTEGIGPGFLRNRLVREHSTAEWLVFLDDDDLLDPQYIEWLMPESNVGANIIYAPCRYPPGAPWRPPIGRFDEARLRSANYIPVTVLMRRDLFDAVGGFRISVPYEDWDLWLQICDRRLGKWGFFSHPCWTYRLHGNAWTPVQ